MYVGFKIEPRIIKRRRLKTNLNYFYLFLILYYLYLTGHSLLSDTLYFNRKSLYKNKNILERYIQDTMIKRFCAHLLSLTNYLFPTIFQHW